MTPMLGMLTFIFNFVGLAICLLGLTLAKRMSKRWPGYSLAVLGFCVATIPIWGQWLVAD